MMAWANQQHTTKNDSKKVMWKKIFLDVIHYECGTYSQWHMQDNVIARGYEQVYGKASLTALHDTPNTGYFSSAMWLAAYYLGSPKYDYCW